jgi:hypothetical protein
MAKKKTNGKRNFSSFDVKEAMQQLDITELTKWNLEFEPLAATSFFAERMRRLENFDLSSTESAKELLIEAFCEEALERHRTLRAWKSAPLSSDELIGTADYLIARRQRYIETPLLCVVEAKKDDFEQGLAQCLVEMQACQWSNKQEGMLIEIYGIVSNGLLWVFYKLATGGEVFETLPYTITNTELLLGALSHIFGKCEENLTRVKKAA